jgi:hypothetical protein
MLGLPGIVAFAAMQFGVISIAATLWLELRREERRLRLVRKVESVLHEEDFCRPGEAYFKRVA